MMIKIDNSILVFEQPEKRPAVAVKRNIENRQVAVLQILNLSEQLDISFYAGYQLGFGLRVFQAILVKGENSIGIAVENVIVHGRFVLTVQVYFSFVAVSTLKVNPHR